MIRILDSYLINQIAAGEVIERPCSIVKELVENSIDANSTSIIIEASDGGLSYIKVTDNGTGITKRDCTLAFERHATSKIYSKGDLEAVKSLGFRGEALATIAAVSQVELLSCHMDELVGTQLINHGGKQVLIKDYASTQGTSITVRNLFYNVPARLKFIKSIRAEASGITDIVSRLIISRPDISFKYVYDNKTIYHSSGDGNLLAAIKSVYKDYIEDNVIELKIQNSEKPLVYGYICKHSFAKKNRNHQTFFINGRYVKNYFLSACLSDAYRTFIPVNTHPWAVLFISIPYEDVDVNVHPSKIQVKFKDEKYIYQTMKMQVRETLVKSMRFDSINSVFNKNFIEENIDQESMVLPLSNRNMSEYVGLEHTFTNVAEESSPNNSLSYEILFNDADKPHIVLIGSVFNTYVIAQSSSNLIIIDQHAAHERILYEKYKESIVNNSISVQNLLTPLIVEVQYLKQSYIRDVIDVLRNTGFDIEMFDLQSLIVRGIPVLMSNINFNNYINDLFDLFTENPFEDQNLKTETVIKLACTNAVKSKKPLSNFEMLSLINRIVNEQIPYTCPHGRPILITISKSELENRFKRK